MGDPDPVWTRLQTNPDWIDGFIKTDLKTEDEDDEEVDDQDNDEDNDQVDDEDEDSNGDCGRSRKLFRRHISEPPTPY